MKKKKIRKSPLRVKYNRRAEDDRCVEHQLIHGTRLCQKDLYNLRASEQPLPQVMEYREFWLRTRIGSAQDLDQTSKLGRPYSRN